MSDQEQRPDAVDHRTIELTVGHLFAWLPLAAQFTQQDLPALVQYRLAKSMRMMRDELRTAESVRHELLDKYVVKDEKGKWQLNADGDAYDLGENAAVFQEAWVSVTTQVVKVDVWPICITMLPDTVVINEQVMHALIFLELIEG